MAKLENGKSAKQVQKEIERIWTKPNTKIPSDVFGSYIGTPTEGGVEHAQEIPVQDADDL